MSLRLVHISDLHFCADETRLLLDRARSELGKLLGDRDIQLSYADPIRVEALKAAINDCDPDVVCVTGDLTTFGDAESFTDALGFLKAIRPRSGAGTDRRIITVPGNHDALSFQLPKLPTWVRAQLEDRLPGWRGYPMRRWITKIERSIPKMGEQKLLANYHELLGKNVTILHSGTLSLEQEGVKVVLVPFNTVSASPFWVNLGEPPSHEFQNFSTLLKDTEPEGRVLRIVLIHHNPLSSPNSRKANLEHAFNSMPTAGTLLNTLQGSGINLLLHGHQHEWNEYRISFYESVSLESLLVLGAPSAAADDPCGFYCLDVVSENRLKVTRWIYKNEVFREEPGGGKERVVVQWKPPQVGTELARAEIRKYDHEDADRDHDFGRVYSPSGGELWIVGTALRTFRKTRIEDIGRKIKKEGANVRIVMASPESELYYDGFGGEAQPALEALRQLKGTLGDDQQERLDYRIAKKGDLVPISATIRDPNGRNGIMVIELLPLREWEDREREGGHPRLTLQKELETALFNYYWRMVQGIFNKAERDAE